MRLRLPFLSFVVTLNDPYFFFGSDVQAHNREYTLPLFGFVGIYFFLSENCCKYTKFFAIYNIFNLFISTSLTLFEIS